MKGTKMRVRHITTTIITLITSLIMLAIAIPNDNQTLALTYSDNVGIEFTFNPTINVSITGDLSIDELVPGGYSDSSIIDVNVATNNSNGYYLSANVGSSTNNPSTELRLSNYNANDGSNGSTNPIFTSLLTTDSYSSMGNDNISPNTWGYSYSLDGTTWSNYSGLPLYNTAGIKLKENYSPSNDTINFKIATKASNTQSSGTYTNTINFIATIHPTPLSLEQSYAYYGKEKVEGTNYYSMQDMNSGICQSADQFSSLEVMDVRDNNTYTIKKINGQCWMTQNLRFTETSLSLDTSNVAEDTTLTYYSLDANDASYTNHCDSTNGYNYACIKNSNDNITGVWYNFYAASASTVAGIDNDTTMVYSICPSGWRLPTGNTMGDSDRDFTKLIGKTTSESWLSPTTSLTAFNAVAGGRYSNGLLNDIGYGFWWSSTRRLVHAETVTSRYILGYNSSSDKFKGGNYYYGRFRGFFVRCVTE